MPQVIRTIEIAAPPSVVWRWLATQAALREWISPNIEIDLSVGGASVFSPSACCTTPRLQRA